MTQPENIVLRVLQYFDNQTHLADFCMVNRSAVTHWKYNNKIPPWHADAIHRFTKIPKWEICPDAFKKEEA